MNPRILRAALEKIEKLEKAAARPPKGFWRSVKQQVSERAPRFAVSLGTGLAVLGGARVWNRYKERIDEAEDFQNMLDVHPSLQREDPTAVQKRYDTLRRVAPTVANDPFAAGSIVKQWIEYPTVSAAALQDAAKIEHYARGDSGLLDMITKSVGVLAGGGD